MRRFRKPTALLLFSIIMVCCKPLLACPCFNSGFLASIFEDSKTVSCYAMVINNNQIIEARIIGGADSAQSAIGGCRLDADYHHFKQEFELYSPNNNLCIDAILHACTSLKITLKPL